MQQLLGRLNALDPQASEALRVVPYFDTLIAGRASVAALVRATAVLVGAPVGAIVNGRQQRVDERGATCQRSDGEGTRAISQPIEGGSVWIERDGPEHANDQIVLERLALAVLLVTARRAEPSQTALEVALDDSRSLEERSEALARLRLTTSSRVRVIATAAQASSIGPRGTVLPTRYGLVSVELRPAGGSVTSSKSAGIGIAVPASALPRSMETAVAALRLVRPSEPVVSAEDLGVLLDAAMAVEHAQGPAEDTENLARLDDRARRIVGVLAEADSLRAAAAELGMHHSTVAGRHESLTAQLGYDPRTLVGRTRYLVADLVLRLSGRDRAE